MTSRVGGGTVLFEHPPKLPYRLPAAQSQAARVSRRSASSLSASSPPTASPRATMPAVSERGICFRVMARISAMAMNGTRYQKTGARELAYALTIASRNCSGIWAKAWGSSVLVDCEACSVDAPAPVKAW